ncbi:helicase POLQ-like [Lampris incognitus]|uniref:helicase POLQ-like n=1 Tax=Lampris incognitus TaxID=2546036 RepID=UPI0024B5272D|nr:helicase POLQ-like [Lampris incognitus]
MDKMNTKWQDTKVKRAHSKKRTRDSIESHQTPAKKGGSASSKNCPDNTERGTSFGGMASLKAVEYCSDSEDFFGDYDSILNDSSFLAKLDDAEQNGVHYSPSAAPLDQPDPNFTALPSSGDNHCLKLSTDNKHSEAIVDGLIDESFKDIEATQFHFQEEVLENAKQIHWLKENKISTPCKVTERAINDEMVKPAEHKSERPTTSIPQERRSMKDQLKRAMISNAAAPSCVSRTIVLKEAVVAEEINVAMQAMETVSLKATDIGPFFGLPTKVKDLICKLRGINNLYDWQKTCLNLDCVQERRNLIYSLPTSGGKTLVAEILMFRELLCRKKDSLFILPYISLVQEKVRGLASFGLELDFMVEEYAGSKGRFPPVKRRSKRSLYIATIEKAHSLVNCLIETNRLDDIGLVIVDELHMLGDGSRGAVVEMTLAKILYVSTATQIIGMSATLGNIKDLQKFLKAENYTSDYRPVQLREYVKLKDSIYEVDPNEEEVLRLSRVLSFKYSSSMQKMDPDHLIALVTEIIPTNSCLVFCSTKKNCENVAGMICKYLKDEFLLHKEKEKAALLKELRDSGNGTICPVLQKIVPYGLAYHHSGLTSEERKLVEEAYMHGVLCLLTCTSTLAAGINLPARRVILRSPYVATEFIKRSQYKQMVGRAGRAGIDSVGESILILQEKDKSLAKSLLCAPVEKCYSNLMQDNGKGVLSLILSLIGLNIASSLEQVRDFLSGTLLCVQERQLCVERDLREISKDCVELLKEKGLITVSRDTQDPILQVTKLGRATYKGAVDLSYCDMLYEDLSKGLDGLMLHSYLHLVYLVTPYDMISQCKPDWMIYLRQFILLSAAEQKMSAAVGVPESFVARKAAGQTVRKNANMVAVRRLYLAIVLFSLLNDTNVWSTAEKFQLNRGFIQALLNSSSAFCSCVLHFTEELEEFWPFKTLLTELTHRLSYCVQAELIPLMEVAGVMKFRAKQLYNAGYKTLAHLANADPSVLAKTIDNLYKKQANQIVASAKMLVNEKAAALQEEVNDLLMMPKDLPLP